MMTSKVNEQTLCSLLFKTTPNYNTNLQTLLKLVNKSKDDSIIVAPEVCLTGFDYDNFDAVLHFAKRANETLKKASLNKTIILTIIEKKGDEIFNLVKVFHNTEIVHERPKAKLFRLGGEHHHFVEGHDNAIEIFEINGIKIALLICFELRFKKLWQQIEGADVIAIPSWWGVLRAKQFQVLTESLAIMNQCYVIASDSLNDECSKMSGIINPQGETIRNQDKYHVEVVYDKKSIKIMRKYLNVGI